ncbi:MAG: hypothetical protein JOZ09_02935 [Pseudonocardiales bacterium]|nr:hypothetical protein [Pseudonocardiales bacterium]
MIDKIVADAEPRSSRNGLTKTSTKKTLQHPAPTRIARLRVLRRHRLVWRLLKRRWLIGRLRVRRRDWGL